LVILWPLTIGDWSLIWFTCKQCGKRAGRSDEMAGSLVFCECGHGNRVPWDSTVAAPELPAGGPWDRSDPDRPRWGRRPSPRPRDPTRCLNHEDMAAAQVCAACGESFCASCVVALQGQTLCGPCKNYRLHHLARPPQTSALAWVAAALGLLSAPVVFCLSMVPLGMPEGPSVGGMACSLFGLVLPAAALVVGLMALREIENNPKAGGRALAMTGTAAAGLGVLWCLTVTLLLATRQLME
jgi:hypothetical protein